MSTATITIKYVNQPKEGKSFGSVKDSTGQMWGVHQSKLNDLKPGQTVDVTYTSKDYQGKEYRNISAFTVKAAAAPPAGGAPRGASTDEQIFITGVVGRALGSGKFDAEDVSKLTVAAYKAWGALQAMRKLEAETPPGHPPLDDEIPF